MSVRLVVTVAADGTITATTENVSGPACMDQIDLMQGLCAPAKIVGSRLTESFHDVVRQAADTENHVIETESETR